jgi:hypothetical protein
MDSNHRYPRERSLLLPRWELARWNRLAAGTGCRLQRAKVSAYSNVSNGAEREPPLRPATPDMKCPLLKLSLRGPAFAILIFYIVLLPNYQCPQAPTVQG